MPFRTINFDDTEDAINSSIDDGFPFSGVLLKGDYDFNTISRDGWLRLDDDDLPFKSASGCYLKVADDFQVKLTVESKNNDYFQDNLKTNLPSVISLSKPSTTLGGEYSRMVFTMSAGDSISIDIDDDISGVAVLKVKHNGTNYAIGSPKTQDDECFIKVDWVKWDDPEYDEDNPQQSMPKDSDEIADDIDNPPASNPDGEGGYTPNPDADNDESEADDDNDSNDDDDDDETPTDPSSILWVIGIGLFVLISVGVITLTNRKGD